MILSGKIFKKRSAKTSDVEGRSAGSPLSVAFDFVTPFPGLIMNEVAVPMAAAKIFIPIMKERVIILVIPCSLGLILATTVGKKGESMLMDIILERFAQKYKVYFKIFTSTFR